MLPQEKLIVIKAHLKTEFKGFELYHDYIDFERQGHTFQLDKDNKIYFVTVRDSVTDNNSPAEITEFLRRHPLKQYFENDKVKRIVVTGTGITLDDS
jgi:hypothetical protein